MAGYAIQYYCTVRLTAKKKKKKLGLRCVPAASFSNAEHSWRGAMAVAAAARQCRRWHRGRLALEHHYFLAKKPVLRRCCCQGSGGTRRCGGGGSGSRRWRHASATAPALSGSVFAWRGANGAGTMVHWSLERLVFWGPNFPLHNHRRRRREFS